MHARGGREGTGGLRLAAACAPLALVLAAALPAAAPAARGGSDPAPSFGREVRPILSEHCFPCHGPDEAAREAELRLDVREAALRDRGGYAALVPGDRGASELWRRVSSATDPMPPQEHGRPLSDPQIATLGRWIDAGAPWDRHWSYVAPRRPEPPPLPAGAPAGWDASAIDRFVLERLAREGLSPAPEASRASLVRRLHLDLTGLPPSPAEVERFLADRGPDAYGALVERLLSSPRFGEHFARLWLDVARYADTHGFHLDNERGIWPYRDWVVRAIDANMPFDRFTVEQLAGDLLPDATDEQRIATGFLRCNPTTAEGGLIEAEYLVKYAVDRASTVATAWMGMTLGCASCHDHKFDPLSQREFYRFYAFFDDLADEASDGNVPAPPPFLRAPSAAQRAELARLADELAAAAQRRDGPLPEVDARQEGWQERTQAELARRWEPLAILAVSSASGTELEVLADGSILASGPNPEREVLEVLATTERAGLTALRLEALAHESLPLGGPGRAENANFVLSGVELALAPRAGGGSFAGAPLAAAAADHAQEGFPASGVLDGDPESGWAVLGGLSDRALVLAAPAPLGAEGGTLLRLRLRFESRFPRHAIGRLRLSAATDPALLPALLEPWSSAGPFAAASGAEAFATDFGPQAEHVAAAAGAPRDAATAPSGEAVAVVWTPRPEWADGQAIDLGGDLGGERSATYARRTIHSPDARAVVLSAGSDDGLRVWLNGELVHEADVQRPLALDQDRIAVRLRPGANELLLKVVNHAGGHGFAFRVADQDLGGLPLPVAEVLLRAPAGRTPEDERLVRDAYRALHSPEWQALDRDWQELRSRHGAYEAALPTTLVAAQRAEPRPTHVLVRGQYDQPGELVEPGVPGCLPPLRPRAAGAADRLDLARWLVDPAHPLTARVTVNRFWQHLFGTGLVATSDDLGSQGEWPSHPELLDWLAVELVESGWDLKGLLRTIVSSAAYRQDARVPQDALLRDPANRLLARGPRFRLDGEVLRDSALAVAGLLVERAGGPPVRPYQPDGVWEAVAYTSSNTAKYERESGEALWRRSLYTFWKRTAPPATLQIFDAPTRETCTVRRARTNTPLQALALMNDVQLVEAARVFAERILREGGASDDERLTFAFLAATARTPEAGEADVLRRVLAAARLDYARDEAAALALLATGERAPDPALDPREVAAWTHVATTLLNLDEFVTKG